MATFITKLAKDLGLKKVDSRSNLPITVSRRDIKLADMKKPGSCAYARACKRSLPGVEAAYFFRSAAWLQYPDKLVRYVLPSSMQKEIVAFDRSRSMEPGTYYLAKPAKTARLGKIQHRSAQRKGGHGHGAGKMHRRVVMTKNIRNAYHA